MSNVFRARRNVKNLQRITNKLDRAAIELVKKEQDSAECDRLIQIVSSLPDSFSLKNLITTEHGRLKRETNKNRIPLGVAKHRCAAAHHELNNAQHIAKNAYVKQPVSLANFIDATNKVYTAEDQIRDELMTAMRYSYQSTIVYDFFTSYRGRSRDLATLKADAESLCRATKLNYTKTKLGYKNFCDNINSIRALKIAYATKTIPANETIKHSVIEYLEKYDGKYSESTKAWINTIRRQSKISIDDNSGLAHVYFGGDNNIPDGKHHGHFVVKIPSPKQSGAISYFRPPGKRTAKYNTHK